MRPASLALFALFSGSIDAASVRTLRPEIPFAFEENRGQSPNAFRYVLVHQNTGFSCDGVTARDTVMPARPPQKPAPPVPTEEELFSRMSLADLNSQHPLDDVFFDFDKSDLRPDGEATLRRNAEWLRKWTSVKVRVDGCADPRGTNEYNFGLGLRRADIIRAFLVSQGIALDRIEVVAVGDTQLVCTEQTEACWSRNRRGSFLITAK